LDLFIKMEEIIVNLENIELHVLIFQILETNLLLGIKLKNLLQYLLFSFIFLMLFFYSYLKIMNYKWSLKILKNKMELLEQKKCQCFNQIEDITSNTLKLEFFNTYGYKLFLKIQKTRWIKIKVGFSKEFYIKTFT
jgi:hypothetical protein